MKKILAVFGVVVVGCFVWLKAEQRNPGLDGNYTTEAVFLEDGNAVNAFAVTVGTSVATQVYAAQTPHMGNYDSPDRLVFIENNQGFALYCATFSFSGANNASSTVPRWVIFSSTTFSTRSTSPIYCEYAAGASSQPVLGRVEYDSRD